MRAILMAVVSLAVSLSLVGCVTAGHGECTLNSGVWVCDGGVGGPAVITD